MAIVKSPSREFRLGEKLPPIPQKVVSWPWGSTPSLTQWSLDQLKYPLGTIIHDVVDGHPVIAQIQTHSYYGAHPDWSNKPHKGTSVFVPVARDEGSGKMVALRDPPDGWGVSEVAGWWPRRRAVELRHEGGEGMHWRDHYARVPKLAVLVGTTAVGALAGPIGAAIGFAAGLFIDREVRGGDLLPHFGDDPSSTDKPAAPSLTRSSTPQHTQAEWDDFLKRHPYWKNKKKPGKPAPPKPGQQPASPTGGGGGGDVFSQAAGAIQSAASAATGAVGAVTDIANAFNGEGDFGVGTVIPSQYKKSFTLIDPNSGAQPVVQGRDMDDAAKYALARYYANAATVVRVPGSNTFQTDKGDTFSLVPA
jgi:hypothetical protein